jgi:hypothetical protein
LEILLSWKATRDDLGELKLLTDDSRTMNYTTVEEKEQLMLETVETEIPEDDEEDEDVG